MEKSKDDRHTISRKVKRQVSALLSIALFIALAVVPVNAQVECLGKCEESFVLCLRNQGNGLSFSASCIETYEQCVEACLGSASALLGCNVEEQPRFAQNAALTHYPDSAASTRSLLARMLNLKGDRVTVKSSVDFWYFHTQPNRPV